jgi:hypothetical protein
MNCHCYPEGRRDCRDHIQCRRELGYTDEQIAEQKESEKQYDQMMLERAAAAQHAPAKQSVRWTLAVLLTVTAPLWILPVLIGAVLWPAIVAAKDMIDELLEVWGKL